MTIVYVCVHITSLFFFLVSPRITNISGNIVTEGGNTTLKCLAEGEPRPTTTWTRVSDGSIISGTLVNVIRQHANVSYRCTAENGVGRPATRDVFVDVQCECCNFKFIYIHNKYST